ncbi:hypothetical protein [Nostoc sp. CMAA1605]|uniref:hypothetical protein n=1 Tax=Nostoc sp. CMAA1605 TaxID=2055159 RepID=UPI001F21C6D6|nr:hypothetical protein [Nostoc sp. CMAA1605]MCF4967866.1 hypothetical protein [Nostoc sp. CMAA1605]
MGDAFTYLNIERGAKIRETITLHLNELIQDYPDENELHIVAHSMGTVILWDMLFSDKFSSGDSAFMFRDLINGRVKLKSITTMGSPILLFNMILDIKKHQIHDFMSDFTQQNLRWTNIIHASDLIAYPLGASLKINNVPNLLINDKFISTSANDLETTVRAVAAFPAVEAASKMNANINQVLYMASLASGAADAHINYWHCPQTAKIIVDNILGSEEKIINVVIERLKRVSGMTILLVENEDSAQTVDSKSANYWDMYFGNIDKLRESFEFCDGSGKLRMRDNLAQIPHVSVYNSQGNCQFKGYVGLIHANGLRKEVEDIKQKYY